MQGVNPDVAFTSRLCRDLAARGAIEDHPHGEVLSKVLEPMLDSRCYEQQVARLEGMPLAVVKEDAAAADDDVELVLGVRRLLIRGYRKRELYVQGTALQKAERVFARGTWDPRLRLSKMNHMATIRLTHVSLLMPPN